MQPLQKTVWSVLKTLKMELPFDPAVSLLGIYPNKIMTLKPRVYPRCHCRIIPGSPGVEAACAAGDREMDKERVVNRHSGIHSALTEKEVLAFAAAWMTPEGIVPSEIKA